MKIFLAGATGFIGGRLLHAFVDEGWQVVCLARPGRPAARLERLALPGVSVLPAELLETAKWSGSASGCDAVVNAVGIIRELRPGEFDDVHRRFPIALFEAAAASSGAGGPRKKCLQISALGADAAAETAYHRTKRAADERLLELDGLESLVLRPSLVYGPGDHSMTFFQSLAALPIVLLPGDGLSRLQPIHVDDVVKAGVQFLRGGLAASPTGPIDAGGEGEVAFRELIEKLAQRLGNAPPWMLPAPAAVMDAVAAATDAVGRGPISGDELSMLRRGNTAPLDAFRDSFGWTPAPLDVGLARTPLSPADRLAARLTLLKPLLRLGIASIWWVTGAICATGGYAASVAFLGRVGLTGNVAAGVLYATCLLELALGTAVACGWKARWACILQLAMIGFFSAALTIVAPELWLDTFGGLTKNIPLAAAICVLWAWEGDSEDG